MIDIFDSLNGMAQTRKQKQKQTRKQTQEQAQEQAQEQRHGSDCPPPSTSRRAPERETERPEPPLWHPLLPALAVLLYLELWPWQQWLETFTRYKYCKFPRCRTLAQMAHRNIGIIGVAGLFGYVLITHSRTCQYLQEEETQVNYEIWQHFGCETSIIASLGEMLAITLQVVVPGAHHIRWAAHVTFCFLLCG